ncbi:MAG: CoA-binding protein [Uliginosibacterium sp.]|nr:CoA-binding protein [Uliginosibacterium sp.]
MEDKHYLSPLFEPRSVAIIGATEREGALGSILVRNMLGAAFRGRLYAVNPKYTRVQDLPCFAKIADVPEKIDLAIIATPASQTPELVEACGAAGVKCAVVVSSGFSESGADGTYLELQLIRVRRSTACGFSGQTVLALRDPWPGLNATLAEGLALPGSIGFVSQSGPCAPPCWTMPVPIARFLRASYRWVYRPTSILARSSTIWPGLPHLMPSSGTWKESAMRGGLSARCARHAPSRYGSQGRHHPWRRALQHAHTGSITGDDAVFEAVFRRSGAVRLDSADPALQQPQGLFLHVLARAANRLAIITNGGGPGVMAADPGGRPRHSPGAALASRPSAVWAQYFRHTGRARI